MSILAQVHTIEDYARLYRGSEPICNSSGKCKTLLELIIKSDTEKYVSCPKCQHPVRLMDFLE